MIIYHESFQLKQWLRTGNQLTYRIFHTPNYVNTHMNVVYPPDFWGNGFTSLLLNVVRGIPNVLAASLALRPPWTARIAADILSSIIIDITRQQLSLKQNWSWKKRRKRTTPKACRSVFDERRSQRLFTFCGSPHACFVKLLEVCHELRSSAFLLPYFLWLFW